MGVTRTNGIPGLPGNNNFKVLEAGAKKLGYKEVPHRQHGDQQRSRATAAAPASRSASASRAASRARNGRRSIPRSPRARRPAISRCARTAMAIKIEHDASGKVTGVVYADKDGSDAAPEGARRGGRRQFDREPAAAAQLRLDQVPGRACQLVRAGRPELHAPHDRLGLCGVREAGAHVSRHHHGRHHPRRGEATIPSAASSAATRWRRCRSACPSWRRSSNPGAWGRAFTSALDAYPRMAGMWIVGEDMPQENQPRHARPEGQGQVRHAGRRTSISTTIPTTSRCATTPTSRAPPSTRRSAPP